MVRVGETLSAYKANPDDQQVQGEMDNSIYDLAHAIRSGIESNWAAA
jgi:hypothetical protein